MKAYSASHKHTKAEKSALQKSKCSALIHSFKDFVSYARYNTAMAIAHIWTVSSMKTLFEHLLGISVKTGLVGGGKVALLSSCRI